MWTGRSLPKSWAISTAFRSMIIGHTRRSLVTTSMEFRSDRSRHFGPCLQSPHKVFRGRAMSRSFALALGGGGARALAHVAVLEALDELNEKPVAVAGSSMGALLGAAYAAGMSGKDIRRFILAVMHEREDETPDVLARHAGGIGRAQKRAHGAAGDGDGLLVQLVERLEHGDMGERAGAAAAEREREAPAHRAPAKNFVR